MFTDVHSFMDIAMAELSRLKAGLETNEAHHQSVIDEMHRDIDNEIAESREAANHFRYEFDNLVHARCQVVAEGLQAMETNQKGAHNLQQQVLNGMEHDMKTMRRSLCRVSDRWTKLKQRNEGRKQLCMKRISIPHQESSTSRGLTIKKIQARKTVFVLHELVESMRLRLKNAAHGLHGDQWSTFMKNADKDGSGFIGFDEFCRMIRHDLKVDESEEHLHIVFTSLDDDDSGQVSLDELVEFVADPTVRMRTRIRNAARNLSGSEFGLDELARHIDKDGSGQISFNEFKLMCRVQLRLLDPDHVLQQVFRALDEDDSGSVSVDELIDFIKRV